jgi:hypothetical protein
LVDGVFKVIAWLALAATIQVAAEATQSVLLWILCAIAYLMIMFYLQTFVSWLSHARLNGSASSLRELRPGNNSKLAAIRGLSRLGLPVIGVAIWLAVILGMQTTIGKSAQAIVEFQKAPTKK